MLGIGALESICQAHVQLSAFEDGVSYAVLVIALVVHHVLWPMWQRWRERRNWRAEEQLTEVRL
jgi:hypothetical protein